MRNVRAVFVLAAVLGLAALLTGTALAARSINFKGSYVGTVTEKVDGQHVTALANASGAGTVVGRGKLGGTVSATTANPPCSPLSGPGTITGPKGRLKLTLVPTASRGCTASEEDQNNISFSGTARVTGGTVAFRKARGTLRFSGRYDRKAGTFNVKLTGKLTY